MRFGSWARVRQAQARSFVASRPRFSVFAIGEYSFALWKVGISGFYNRLDFKVIGPHEGKPVVLDDSSYFLSCDTQAEALFIASLLNSEDASGFFGSFIFWDAKRPITVDILERLDLRSVAVHMGVAEQFDTFLAAKNRGTDLFNQ